LAREAFGTVVSMAFVAAGPSAFYTLAVRGEWFMKRILSVSAVFAGLLVFGLTGCGDSGNLGEGVPKDVKSYVPLTGPNGTKGLSTDMTEHGIKPPGKGADKGGPPPAPTK